MADLLKEKPNYGQVMVYIGNHNKTLILEARQRLKAEFPDLKNLLTGCTYGLYVFECMYTLEDKVYPLLKDIYKDTLKDTGTLLGFGVFLSGMYTEMIALDKSFENKNVDVFKVGAIDKIEGKEYGRIAAKIYAQDDIQRKAIEQSLQKSKFPGFSTRKNSPDAELVSKIKFTSGDTAEACKEFVCNVERVKKIASSAIFSDKNWHVIVLEPGTETKGPYAKVVVTDGRENLYQLSALNYQSVANPLSMWEEFFFLPTVADIRIRIEGGFCIDAGDSILVVANPNKPIRAENESDEKEFDRTKKKITNGT